MSASTMSEGNSNKTHQIACFYITGLLFVLIMSSCVGRSTNEIATPKKLSSPDKVKDSSYLEQKVVYLIAPEGRIIDSIYYQSEDRGGLFANYIRDYPNSDTIVGDFDGDGTEEIATVQNIKYYNTQDSSIDWEACQCVIRFSNVSIKTLIVETCTEGVFKNEGDLNDDGRDEIGILPGWISSGCRQYHVYTFRDNEWVQICEPIENSYNMREAGVVLIEKDKKKGYAVIRQSVDSFISEQENNIPYKYYQGSSCAWSNVVERTIKLK